jgi:hypothetical protein
VIRILVQPSTYVAHVNVDVNRSTLGPLIPIQIKIERFFEFGLSTVRIKIEVITSKNIIQSQD